MKLCNFYGLSKIDHPMLTRFHRQASFVVFSAVGPEGEDENLTHREAVLLQDLSFCRHRQVLHPVLQEGECMHISETADIVSALPTISLFTS